MNPHYRRMRKKRNRRRPHTLLLVYPNQLYTALKTNQNSLRLLDRSTNHPHGHHIRRTAQRRKQQLIGPG
jgi:hypothetical protein